VGGSEGGVYVLDTRSRQCIDKFTDEGSLRTTAVATTP
jgi:hypothetical protein